MIYIVKAWAHKDGETAVFCFSSEGKREKFLDDLRRDAKDRTDSNYYWDHIWETAECELDPMAPVGN